MSLRTWRENEAGMAVAGRCGDVVAPDLFFLFFNAVVPEWIDVVVPGWCGGVRRARTWPQGHSRLPQNVSTVDTNHQSSHRQGVRSSHDVHTYSCPLPTAGEKLCRCPPVLMFSTGVLSPARITTTKQVSLAASHGFFNSPLPLPVFQPPSAPLCPPPVWSWSHL